MTYSIKMPFLRQVGLLILLCSFSSLFTYAQDSRATLFDTDWRFKKDSLIQAESPTYTDTGWRKLTLPHDWSIEDLPNQQDGNV